MKLEQQVCSLELAKRLKELGVKQESYFRHVRLSDKPDLTEDWYILDRKPTDYLEIVSAFTVAELWELCSWDKIVFSNMDKDWKVQYQANGHTENDVRCFDSRNGSDAMAKMLIYLLSITNTCKSG